MLALFAASLAACSSAPNTSALPTHPSFSDGAQQTNETGMQAAQTAPDGTKLGRKPAFQCLGCQASPPPAPAPSSPPSGGGSGGAPTGPPPQPCIQGSPTSNHQMAACFPIKCPRGDQMTADGRCVGPCDADYTGSSPCIQCDRGIGGNWGCNQSPVCQADYAWDVANAPNQAAANIVTAGLTGGAIALTISVVLSTGPGAAWAAATFGAGVPIAVAVSGATPMIASLAANMTPKDALAFQIASGTHQNSEIASGCITQAIYTTKSTRRKGVI